MSPTSLGLSLGKLLLLQPEALRVCLLLLRLVQLAELFQESIASLAVDNRERVELLEQAVDVLDVVLCEALLNRKVLRAVDNRFALAVRMIIINK
jgi:hypothetical protein